ncbi:hypothetical protein LZ31DRAFT_624529 [Colletotrichum somersetense]|nr:hypothetical protein LZ31DRAFT_624529 [Colletotrichum somersetense]
MPPRQRCHVDASNSDDSFSPSDDDISDDTSNANEDVFDVNEDKDGLSTDATDVKDLDEEAELNVEDQIMLFGGNLYPPDYWRRAVEEMNESEFKGQDYSPLTTALLDNYLSQKVSKDRRKRNGIKKKSLLGIYWKIFRLMFKRAIGKRIASKLGRSMRKVIRRLAKKHGLNDQVTTQKMFKVGEVCILAVLFVLLVASAGAYYRAIARLHFRDIRVVLIRDPEGRPHKLLIRFTLKFTKEYLGSLTSPDQLKKLDICPGELKLPLPLREDLNDTYIFRRAVLGTKGYILSTNEPISKAIMGAWFKRIGELIGLEYSTILYSLRYNAANGFNQSADVSEALQNLGILRGQRPQQALIKQSGSISHSISRHRPTDLTQEQLPPCSQAYRDTRQEINNEKQRLKRELKQSDSFTKPAVVDTCRPQGPAQKRLLTALTAPLIATLKDQFKQRDNAINTVSAYCLVQKGCTRHRPQPQSKDLLPKTPSSGSEVSPLSLTTLSVYARNKTERPRRCFLCIGQAHCLLPDDPQVDDLIQEFYSSNGLTRHFKRKHLSKMKADDKIECKVCKMPLVHRMHLQRHAFEVHGTVS